MFILEYLNADGSIASAHVITAEELESEIIATPILTARWSFL